MPIKKVIKSLIHSLWLKKKYYIYKNVIKNEFNDIPSKKRIVLIGSPEHDNLGDHAISVAECKFIKEKLPEFCLIEITNNSYRYASKYLKKFINKNDIIMLTGGGLMGSLWPEEEKMITDILESFCENRIVIMPQTVFFSDDDYGIHEAQKLKDAIERCRRLYIFCRDMKSCNLFEDMDITAYCMPDMALYLKYDDNNERHDYIGVCFRNDKECCLEKNVKKYVLEELSRIGEIKNLSTIAPHHIQVADRETELKHILDEISCCKLLLTDRLHAMLFAVITKTPCIAFDNLSNKVSGVYNWISDCNFIYCVKNKQEFKDAFSKLNEFDKSKCDYELPDKYFDELAKIIKAM